jgi:hypothetical protein
MEPAAPPEPSFLTLDRVGTDSRWGAQIHTGMGYRGTGAVGLRADLFGRYMSRIGLGGYAQISAAAMANVDESLISDDHDASGLNNTEIGGLYALRHGGFALMLRAGVVLHTATWDDPRAPSLLSAARVIDESNISLSGWWTRLSASPRLDRGAVFMQLDVGIDHPHGRENDPIYSDRTSPIIHLGAAAGVRSHKLAITAEGAVYILNDSDIVRAELDASLAASVRYLGTVEPYIGIVRPVEWDLPGPGLVVITGIEGTLP